MASLKNKFRRAFKWCFGAFSVTAVAFVFQACYGPAPAPDIDEFHLEGRVLSAKTKEPIPGIKVSLEGNKFEYQTTNEGYFLILSQINGDDKYRLHFEDVTDDGKQYLPKDTVITSETKTLEILLDEE